MRSRRVLGRDLHAVVARRRMNTVRLDSRGARRRASSSASTSVRRSTSSAPSCATSASPFSSPPHSPSATTSRSGRSSPPLRSRRSPAARSSSSSGARRRSAVVRGFLVVALTWLLVPALGALPYLFSGEEQLARPIDAAGRCPDSARRARASSPTWRRWTAPWRCGARGCGVAQRDRDPRARTRDPPPSASRRPPAVRSRDARA